MKRSALIVSKVSDVIRVDPGGMRTLAHGLKQLIEEQERLRAKDHRDPQVARQWEMVQSLLAQSGYSSRAFNSFVHRSLSGGNYLAALAGRSLPGGGFDSPAIMEVDTEVNMDIDFSSDTMSVDEEMAELAFPFTYPAVAESFGMVIMGRPSTPPAIPENFMMEVISPIQPAPLSVDVRMMSPVLANRRLGPVRRRVHRSERQLILSILGKREYDATTGPQASSPAFKTSLTADFHNRPIFVLRREDKAEGSNVLRLGVNHSEWVEGHALPQPSAAVIEPPVPEEVDSQIQVQRPTVEPPQSPATVIEPPIPEGENSQLQVQVRTPRSTLDHTCGLVPSLGIRVPQTCIACTAWDLDWSTEGLSAILNIQDTTPPSGSFLRITESASDIPAWVPPPSPGLQQIIYPTTLFASTLLRIVNAQREAAANAANPLVVRPLQSYLPPFDFQSSPKRFFDARTSTDPSPMATSHSPSALQPSISAETLDFFGGPFVCNSAAFAIVPTFVAGNSRRRAEAQPAAPIVPGVISPRLDDTISTPVDVEEAPIPQSTVSPVVEDVPETQVADIDSVSAEPHWQEASIPRSKAQKLFASKKSTRGYFKDLLFYDLKKTPSSSSGGKGAAKEATSIPKEKRPPSTPPPVRRSRVEVTLKEKPRVVVASSLCDDPFALPGNHSTPVNTTIYKPKPIDEVLPSEDSMLSFATPSASPTPMFRPLVTDVVSAAATPKPISARKLPQAVSPPSTSELSFTPTRATHRPRRFRYATSYTYTPAAPTRSARGAFGCLAADNSSSSIGELEESVCSQIDEEVDEPEPVEEVVEVIKTMPGSYEVEFNPEPSSSRSWFGSSIVKSIFGLFSRS